MGTVGNQRVFAGLKHRSVFRVMAVYGAVTFGVLQVADIMLLGLGLLGPAQPRWVTIASSRDCAARTRGWSSSSASAHSSMKRA
jgi:hypothetical protein